MPRVVIVDDHPAVRTGAAQYLACEDGIVVEAAVPTAGAAEEACRRLRPDVLVADYHLPDGDGLSLCMELGPDGPGVVLYSAFADEHLVVLAIVAGARAVMQKSGDPRDLIAAVKAVAAGERLLPPLLPPAMQEAGARLDGDDLPILGMLVHDVPPGEIASTLAIGQDTLAARRRAMFERLRGGGLRWSAGCPSGMRATAR
jgi:DNA-binding NarL/FixJ family response regulator